MNSRIRYSTTAAIIILAISVLVMPTRALAQSDKDDADAKSFLGAWRTTISPIPGDPTQFPAFPGLLTINEERTLSETDGSQVVAIPAGALGPNPLFATPGHGVWQETASHKLTIKFLQIIVNGNDSTIFATATLQFTIRLDSTKDHFDGKGSFKVVDVYGTILFSGNEQISGDRIKID